MLAQFRESSDRSMKRQLRVEIIQSGVQQEIGIVQGVQMLIGREPDEGGITVPNQAVSRNHGIFVRLRNHWFYKDLGSTNGSWINGVQAKEGVWKLVRAGDVLQLADAALSLSEDADAAASGNQVTGFPALGGVSLIIFSKGEFLDEYPVPEYGRALVLGGSQGDLQVEGNLDEHPSLVIERRSMNVCAFPVARTLKVMLNEDLLSGSINLNDRDELRVAHYYIIFNNPIASLRNAPTVETSKHLQASADANDTQNVTWRDWGENQGPDLGRVEIDNEPPTRSNPVGRGIFGRAHSDDLGIDETIAIDSNDADSHIARQDMHPSMRFVVDEPDSGANLASLDEKIIFGIGIILLLGLMALMLYWLFA